MAEAAAPEVFDHRVPGATKCKSPGCPNWFKRAGNRHRYCKADNCTYRRGTPAELLGQAPKGAAEEVLRRLQAPEGEESGEVGPELLAHRRQAVQGALRAGDREALAGALIDEAAACIWWADRSIKDEPPRVAVAVVPGAPARAERAPTTVRPIGLAHAVLSSHQRTFQLAEHRVKLLWAMLSARDEVLAAERGVEQTAGSPQEEDAQEVLAARRQTYQRSERAYEAVEAAWRERALTLAELSAAGATTGPGAATGPTGPSGPPAMRMAA